jgi:uncharacterized membrane protein YcaP (DUF421 family)
MDIALRSIVLFGFLSLIMRIVGRRELSSMSATDLVLLIVLGDAAQQGLAQDDYSVTGAMIVISTLAVLQVALSYMGFRFPRLRPALEGEPVVIIQDGKVFERNLRRDRLDLDEVTEEARQKEISSLDDVAWAILEPNGKISFIPKA